MLIHYFTLTLSFAFLTNAFPLTGYACSPTFQQVANRTSTGSLPSIPQPQRPIPRGKYCDPTFGTEVLRISDSESPVNVVDSLGQLGFNQGATKIATLIAGGMLRIYGLDPIQMTAVGSGKTLYPVKSSMGETLLIESSSAVWSNSAAPEDDASNTIIISSGLIYYSVNVTTLKATPIADISSLFADNTPSNPKNFGYLSLRRCSANRGTKIFSCAILLRLKGDLGYPRIGYVTFRILNNKTTDPANNWELKTKFINGIDSPSIDVYQNIQSLDANGKMRTYSLYSPYEGGYKLSLDRTGRFVLVQATQTFGLQYNTMVILDTNFKGSTSIKFLQAAGHGDVGDSMFYGETTAYGTCDTCLKKWDLTSLSGNPGLDENNGTPISDRFGYFYGRQYASSFALSSDVVTVILSCPDSGCGDNPYPYSGEIIQVRNNGSKQINRVVRLYHLGAPGYDFLQVIESQDGHFIAFTANFGIANESHVFIVRVPSTDTGVPTLNSVSPSVAIVGAINPVTITGTNLDYKSNITISGSGATIAGVQIVGPTQINATLFVDTQANPGPRSINLVAPAPSSQPVTITIADPPPTISRVKPSTAQSGSVVAIEIAGTNFSAGASVFVEGSGYATGVVVVSSTLIRATLAIPASVAASTSNLVVSINTSMTNPIPFTITNPIVTIPEPPVFQETFDVNLDYIYAEPSQNCLVPEGKYTIVGNPRSVHPLFASFGDHTPLAGGAGKMLVVNGKASTLVWGHAVFGLTPGQYYRVSAYAASAHSANPAILRWSVTNGPIGNSVTLGQPGAWIPVTLLFVATGTSATLNLTDINNLQSGNDFVVDDIEIVRDSDNKRLFYEDFEMTLDYAYAPPSANALLPEGVYTLTSNPKAVHPLYSSFGDHTSGTGTMIVVNGKASTLVWGHKISQLTIGVTYVASAWAASAHPANPAQLQFSLSSGATGPLATLPVTPGLWTKVSFTFVATATTEFLSLRDLNPATGGNDFALDDIVVGK